MNASQNTDFFTKFQTLHKDFFEMRKFQLKPLKPRCDICLKTPNPEGFCVTPKTRQVRDDSSQVARGGGVPPPLATYSSASTEPFNPLQSVPP